MARLKVHSLRGLPNGATSGGKSTGIMRAVLPAPLVAAPECSDLRI